MSLGKILIVDDDFIGRQLLEAILQREGYTVVTASSGFEAIEYCKTNIPQLILLDIMMPEMNGYETITELKKLNKTNSIPIITLTALDDRDSRIKSLEAGVTDFVSKPYDRIELLAKIKNTISKYSNPPENQHKSTSENSNFYNELVSEIELYHIEPEKFKCEIANIGTDKTNAVKHYSFRSNSQDIICFYGSENQHNQALLLALIKLWLIIGKPNDTLDLENTYNFLLGKLSKLKYNYSDFSSTWFIVVSIDETRMLKAASYNQQLFTYKEDFNFTKIESLKPTSTSISSIELINTQKPIQFIFLSDYANLPKIDTKTLEELKTNATNSNHEIHASEIRKAFEKSELRNCYVVRLLQKRNDW